MARTAMDEHFGGAVDLVPVSDYNLPLPSGVPGAVRMHILRPGVSGLNVVLPIAALCPQAVGGEPTFTIINFGAHALTLKDVLGSTVTTIAVDEALQVILQDSGTVQGIWIYRKTAGAVESGAGIPNVGEPFVISLQSGTNVSIRELCNQQGYTGIGPANVTAGLFVSPGSSIALIGSTSTSEYALSTGVFPAGSTLQLNIGVGAFICGKGGAGGAGAPIAGLPSDGDDGGPALLVEVPTILVNYGKIQGGGGGGAGDASVAASGSAPGGGGGGGAGYELSFGGYSQNPSSTGGVGGVQAPGYGGVVAGAYYGGIGGAAGSNGNVSSNGSAVGGSAGNAIAVVTSALGSLTKTVAGTIDGAEVTL